MGKLLIPVKTEMQSKILENAGWTFKDGNKIIDVNANFYVIYPVWVLFGLH